MGHSRDGHVRLVAATGVEHPGVGRPAWFDGEVGGAEQLQ